MEKLKINYIDQHKQSWSRMVNDKRIDAFHLSLYQALFMIWNSAHWKNPISISKEEMIRLSRNSKNKYYRSMKELNAWGYIGYEPSFSPLIGSKVYMINFCLSKGQVKDSSVFNEGQANGHDDGPYIKKENKKNLNKQLRPRDLKIIIEFFLLKGSSKNEAIKFFNFYESRNWKIRNSEINNWKPSAENWILREDDFKTLTPAAQDKDSSRNDGKKNYNGTF